MNNLLCNESTDDNLYYMYMYSISFKKIYIYI